MRKRFGALTSEGFPTTSWSLSKGSRVAGRSGRTLAGRTSQVPMLFSLRETKGGDIPPFRDSLSGNRHLLFDLRYVATRFTYELEVEHVFEGRHDFLVVSF